jgi:tetratricopeptide (TPR) repeat protein
VKRLLLFALSLAAGLAPARDKSESWVEVRSPHFVVATNSSEKHGRRIADQFERMRSVFHAAFPKLQIDPGSPIIVLAIKDEKGFRALEPEAYLAKGSLKLGGLFLRAPDKNYVLMRLDAEGEHPYSIIYHEYTHLLLSKAAEWMPLWMNEGLAEFYENTDIHEKDAELGQPSSENIALLRQNRLLPLTTLFAVDEKSPYYHEEHKGSIFYAESWAVTHYLEINDFKQKTHRITDYLTLLAQKTDPVVAATQAFGDLKQLEKSLDSYVQQGSFSYFKMTTTTEVDDSAFQVQSLTPPQADALRADFLAYNRRTADARPLLDQVLKEDPNNVSARETLGFIEFQQGHLDEAKKWYAEAVHLDSQSFLAHYYFAAIAMSGSTSDDSQVEASLRTAIKLNPSFAPAYDRLAVFLGMRHRNLEEARTIGLNAVTLDPANIAYRVNVANVLLTMGQDQDAIAVLRFAAKLAKSQKDIQTVDDFLQRVQEYAAAKQRIAEQNRRVQQEAAETGPTGSEQTPITPRLARRGAFVPSGPHRFVVGVLKNVHCDQPVLEVAVMSKAKTLVLHTDNYYKIQFSALGFQPSADLKPCTELENRPAKVEYVESANKSDMPELISIELHK